MNATGNRRSFGTALGLRSGPTLFRRCASRTHQRQATISSLEISDSLSKGFIRYSFAPFAMAL